jgi:hypothetical protein
MDDAKIVIVALKCADQFFKMIVDLYGQGLLLHDAPEYAKKQFVEFLVDTGRQCAHAIAILERSSLENEKSGNRRSGRSLH